MDSFTYLASSRDGGWLFQETGEPDAFELKYWVQSDSEGFHACSSQLEQELRDHWALSRYRPARTDHLNLILANLVIANRKVRRKGVKFHRQARAYSGRTAQWPHFLSARTLSAVIDGLETLGYVETLLGTFDPASGTGFLSQVRPTDKLRELWKTLGVAPEDIKHACQTPLVELRGKKPPRGRAPFVEPIHSQKFMEVAHRVQTYNEYLSRQSISLDCEGQRRGPMECRVHRVFNDESGEEQTLSRGGRFYGAFWHRIRDDRSKLLINGEPTVELDYGSFHIRMIYHLNGLQCDTDPYEIPAVRDFLDDQFVPEQRDFVKELTNRLINSNGHQVRALGTATGDDIEREFEVRLKNGVPLGAVLDVIRDTHAPVATSLGRGIGLRLQNLDSEICDQIHHALTGQDVPVLSVHDSFTVGRSVENELRSAMIHSYKSVVGTDFDPAIKKVGSSGSKVVPVSAESKSIRAWHEDTHCKDENTLLTTTRGFEIIPDTLDNDNWKWLEDAIKDHVI